MDKENMNKYLTFREEECPHCKGIIDITIYTKVVDRFMVDYLADVEKSE